MPPHEIRHVVPFAVCGMMVPVAPEVRSIMRTVTARDASIPVLGFGTWQIHGKAAQDAVAYALAEGYRHVDTAQDYDNEESVGAGLRDATVGRDEVFLTTKVRPDRFRPGDLRASVTESLRKLDTDYVDLLLLHWPVPEVPLPDTLGALAEVVEAGQARHAGVSNFPSALLAEADNLSATPLVTDQVEYHPYLPQTTLLRAVRERGMALTAYSPLARGELQDDPVLTEIAADHDATIGQIALAWLLHQDSVVAIPKSATRQRISENLASQRVTLNEEEMTRIHSLARPDNAGRLLTDDAVTWDVD